MSDESPESSTIRLPDGTPLLVPPQMMDALRQYYQAEPNPLIAVITTRPSPISRELEAKVNAKPYRRFRIIMKDGAVFNAPLPGAIGYWHNTFSLLGTTPHELHLVSNIDHIEDMGPSGIDWSQPAKDLKQSNQPK